jgi:hypothetical protein
VRQLFIRAWRVDAEPRPIGNSAISTKKKPRRVVSDGCAQRGHRAAAKQA